MKQEDFERTCELKDFQQCKVIYHWPQELPRHAR